MLEQPLQKKQVPDGKRLIVAARGHMASCARECGKNFVRRAFAVPVQVLSNRGRPAFADRNRDPSRMLIRRRGLWLGWAHRLTPRITNRSREPRPGLVKVGKIHCLERALGIESRQTGSHPVDRRTTLAAPFSRTDRTAAIRSPRLPRPPPTGLPPSSAGKRQSIRRRTAAVREAADRSDRCATVHRCARIGP
jgi:hypothetical protein